MTPRSLILMKAFWFYCHFSEAMSFSRFALLSRKSQFTYRKFSIVWLPRVKCLLLFCKAKPAWIKRSIHYVTLQHYNPGDLLKEIPPYLKRDFWYKRSKFWKWHCLRKMALGSKRWHDICSGDNCSSIDTSPKTELDSWVWLGFWFRAG